MLGILVNVMIYVSFGFDRRMDYRVARGLYVAIGFQTRLYNSASNTVLHVIGTTHTGLPIGLKSRHFVLLGLNDIETSVA